MNSAVWRLRRAFLWSLLSFAFFTPHPGHAQDAAGPAKVTVTVQPTNGTAQKTTCAAAAYKCTLPVTIQAAGKTETLTVNIFHVPGNTLFSFQTTDGYLYAGNKPQADPQYPVYMALWGGLAETATPSTANITLYEPYVPNPAAAQPINAPGKAVADLQITVEAAP